MEEENLIVDDLSKNTYLEPNIEICDVEDWVVYENENDPAFSHLAKVLLNKIPSNENDIDWDNLDYNLYNKNYYKKMHPKFSDEVHSEPFKLSSCKLSLCSSKPASQMWVCNISISLINFFSKLFKSFFLWCFVFLKKALLTKALQSSFIPS